MREFLSYQATVFVHDKFHDPSRGSESLSFASLGPCASASSILAQVFFWVVLNSLVYLLNGYAMAVRHSGSIQQRNYLSFVPHGASPPLTHLSAALAR